jgi:hypothetical protein
MFQPKNLRVLIGWRDIDEITLTNHYLFVSEDRSLGLNINHRLTTQSSFGNHATTTKMSLREFPKLAV